MSGVAVKIRAAGDGEAECRGKRAIALLGRDLVIAVTDLEGCQAGRGQPRQ